MSESSESFVDINLLTLTNAEYNKLKQNYFKLNPGATDLDCGFELNNFGFTHQLYADDDFLHLFSIVDRKKYEYARIKYEF